jgi:PadR family transcriptional regulator, regulatory protein PadR
MDQDLLSVGESLLMTAILLQSNDAYGAAIFDRASELAKPTKVSYGSLYPTLERLEKKGFLKSKFGDPIPERGGKSRRYFSVTAAGQAALRRSDAFTAKISAGLAEAWGMA